MAIQVKNNASSTLASAITSIATSLSVAAGTGSRFPTLGGSDYFYATIISTTGVVEIVKVTARFDDSFTIVRAQEGTLAVPFAADSRIEIRITAQNVTDIATAAANAVIATTVYTASLGSTDNRIIRTDGTDTRKAQGSAVSLDDVGNLATPGYIDLTEQAVPGAPAVNVARVYAYDSSGSTRLGYKDNAGVAYAVGTVDSTLAFGADNRLIRADGTDRNIQDSPVTIDDSGNVSGVASQTMTGTLRLPDGTAGAPSLTFSGDTNTGFYRKTADTIGVAVGGSEIAEISPRGSTFIPTGVMMPYIATAAPTGWVRANGRTIGSASSGAVERANADTESLYTILWNSYSDSVCPVTGGRGASASADFAANKPIGLPDLRGRSFFGLDGMGNTAASRLGSVITSSTTNGASGGAETVTLAEANLPAHTHAAGTLATASAGAHQHNLLSSNTSTVAPGTAITASNTISYTRSTGNAGGDYLLRAPDTPGDADIGISSSNGAHTHSITGSSASVGSGTAVSNMPPAFLTTFIIKL